MEQVKEVFKKSKVKLVIYILGSIVIALLIFQAGIYVGIKKAGFSFQMGEQYFRQMNNMPNDNFMGINRQDFTDSHGSIGKIISIKLPLIVVVDKDGTEKIILISTSTKIEQFKDSIKSSDLKINDYIIVIGAPNNNAELEAKLIRIMPDPKNMPFRQATTTNHN